MLEGIIVRPLTRINDERGSFTEIIRTDWKDLLTKERMAQANLSKTYPGTIRAWHRHARGQTDYMIVVNGAAKICAYDEETREIDEIFSTSEDLQIVRMPGHYWHGFKAYGKETTSLVYFTTRLYEHADPDEERRAWNDPSIVPRIINGNKKDPRVGKPWDWDSPPHK